jgi:FkbM family methyltransferase
MKRLSSFFESIALLIVRVVPYVILSRILNLLPSSLMARLISSFEMLNVYTISLCDTTFLIESGPRDDHYLHLAKDRLRGWESEALKIWATEVRNAEIAIDVGAYFGIYSIVAAKLGCPKVLAIEPNSSNFLQLQRNLSLNELSGSVQTFRVAVGAEAKTVSVITPNGRPNSSGSKISHPSPIGAFGTWVIESEVMMVKLDSLLTNESARSSVIKIDAEGYEMFILQGATKTLSLIGPSMLIELLDSEKKSQADKFLKDFGYSEGVPIELSGVPSNYFYKRLIPITSPTD